MDIYTIEFTGYVNGEWVEDFLRLQAADENDARDLMRTVLKRRWGGNAGYDAIVEVFESRILPAGPVERWGTERRFGRDGYTGTLPSCCAECGGGPGSSHPETCCAACDPDTFDVSTAMDQAIAALTAAGFHSPESEGRDLEDGMTITSPAGFTIHIIPICEEV